MSIDWVAALRDRHPPSPEPHGPAEGGPVKGAFRTMLVEHRPLVRRGLAATIEEGGAFAVCAEAATGEEAVEEARRVQPDLALVSADAESVTVDLVRRLVTVHPPLLVLVLTEHERPVYAEAMLQAGARGYLASDVSGERLRGALHRVAAGEVELSDDVIDRLLQAHIERRAAPSADTFGYLSARELQVFELMAAGHPRREIALRLHVSAKTVDVYRYRIRAKLHVKEADDLGRLMAQWTEGNGR
jgi:DNA-binding NarL/FixJ family response regulator